jgi:hypothetical protein
MSDGPIDAQDEEPRPPRRTLITTRKEYFDAADEVLAQVQRELRIFDPDLKDLRLDTPPRIALLREFLLRHRDNRLHISLRDVDFVRLHCPRLITLLGNFAPAMQIWQAQGDAARVQDCFILADRKHVVRRPVALQPRGVFILDDPREGFVMQERFNEIWEISVPSVSANTSGL